MSSQMPDPQTCERARLSRDPRFDGLFFTAVCSTGIYCRPVCPAPPPKPRHVAYFDSAAAAEAAGFRPCLRCRPELAPGQAWRGGDGALTRALALIEHGALAELSLAALAARVGIGERQLRRLFVERLGASPLGVHGTRRLLFAKQLLSETALPITEVALAAGFGSLRRFNEAFRRAYRLPPSALRERPRATGQVLALRLGYRPPFDFAATLDFLRARALPGIEQVGDAEYRRLLGAAAAPGWLRLRAAPRGHALQLELHGVPTSALLPTVARLRRMFDLDAEPQAIAAVLGADPLLAPLIAARPGLRLPGAWDGFEAALRAVLGQQVSVAAARTLAARLLQRHGSPVDSGVPGLDRLLPAPAQLVDADFEAIGVTRARAASLRAIARAVAERRIDFSPGVPLDHQVEACTALPGIGPWTAHYIALRASSHPDAFPAEDLVLRRAAGAGTALGSAALRARAEAWRPWRAYAVIHLWRHASEVAAVARGRQP